MAAEGMVSNTAELPLALHQQLPASVTAIKGHRKRSVFNRWKVLWTSSPRYERLSKIDSSLPSRKLYNTRRASLGAPQASSLSCAPDTSLNAFLKKINAADSALCRHCREPEAVTHFLKRCKRYTEQRNALRCKTRSHACSATRR